MTGTICSVAICRSNAHLAKKTGEPTKFFNFPKNEQLRKEWVRRCYRKDKFDPKFKRICSKHFKCDDYEDLVKAKLMNELPRRLKTDCVPSLHLLPDDENNFSESVEEERKEQAFIKIRKDLLPSPTNSAKEKNRESDVQNQPSSSKETSYKVLLRKYNALVKENKDLKKKILDSSGSDKKSESDIKRCVKKIVK